MRLEYKVGIVVGLVLIALGAWFFLTRDRGGEPLTTEAETGAMETVSAEGATAAPEAGSRHAWPGPEAVMVRAPERTGRVVDASPRPAAALAPAPTTQPSAASVEEGDAESGTASSSDSDDVSMAADTAGEPTEPPTRTAPEAVVSAVPVRPEPKPEPAKTHVIEAGDTISSLAVKYYGSARYTNYILQANKQIEDPRRIFVGTKITIPPLPREASGSAAGSSGGATTGLTRVSASPGPRVQPPGTKPYVVQKGDTWNSLARRFLGDESRGPELFEQNRRSPADSLHMLRAGDTIYVPEKAAGTADRHEAPRTLMGTRDSQ
jgi:nucleoid-associated protein YgaU